VDLIHAWIILDYVVAALLPPPLHDHRHHQYTLHSSIYPLVTYHSIHHQVLLPIILIHHLPVPLAVLLIMEDSNFHLDPLLQIAHHHHHQDALLQTLAGHLDLKVWSLLGHLIHPLQQMLPQQPSPPHPPLFIPLPQLKYLQQQQPPLEQQQRHLQHKEG